MDELHVHRLDSNIRSLFVDGLRAVGSSPASAVFMLKVLWQQQRASWVRAQWSKRGLHVPPFVIVSVTRRCNLNCRGCYAKLHRSTEPEMSTERLNTLFHECRHLGISIALVAGGEPLTRPDLLTILSQHPKMVFALFTNGLLIDKAVLTFWKKHRHVVPVLSLEGELADTNLRRGVGVFEHVQSTMDKLQGSRVPFGVSITVTNTNVAMVTNNEFVAELFNKGCRLFIYVDYIPVEPGSEHLVLTLEQSRQLVKTMAHARRKHRALFIAFPGDEEQFGGCLAAGRGFLHISPDGSLEPCPFSPFSDTSLRDGSLQDALQSPLLQVIRANHNELQETQGGCALWEKRDWVRSLLKNEDAKEQ